MTGWGKKRPSKTEGGRKGDPTVNSMYSGRMEWKKEDVPIGEAVEAEKAKIVLVGRETLLNSRVAAGRHAGSGAEGQDAFEWPVTAWTLTSGRMVLKEPGREASRNRRSKTG